MHDSRHVPTRPYPECVPCHSQKHSPPPLPPPQQLKNEKIHRPARVSPPPDTTFPTTTRHFTKCTLPIRTHSIPLNSIFSLARFPFRFAPLHYAARKNRIEVAKVLLAASADVNALGGAGKATALVRLCGDVKRAILPAFIKRVYEGEEGGE